MGVHLIGYESVTDPDEVFRPGGPVVPNAISLYLYPEYSVMTPVMVKSYQLSRPELIRFVEQLREEYEIDIRLPRSESDHPSTIEAGHVVVFYTFSNGEKRIGCVQIFARNAQDPKTVYLAGDYVLGDGPRSVGYASLQQGPSGNVLVISVPKGLPEDKKEQYIRGVLRYYRDTSPEEEYLVHVPYVQNNGNPVNQ